MFVVYRFSEARLDLLGHIEIVEDGYRSIIHLNDILPLRCDDAQVVFDFFKNGAVVHVDTIVSGIEKITKQGHCTAFLLKAQLWSVCCLLYFRDGFFPTLQ